MATTFNATTSYFTVNPDNTGVFALQANGATVLSVSANNASFTGTATFTGSPTNESLKLTNIAEAAYINTNAIAANTVINVASGAVQYWTTNASSNTTVNITWSSGATMNQVMSVGDSVSVAFLMTNGSTAYYPTAYQIDGVGITPKWQANTIPSGGNASGIDLYTFSIIKTAATPSYTILAAQTQFK